MWRATVLTIFPGMFPGPLGDSLAGKASQKGLWSLAAVDIRDFAADRHRMVDDTPAGGGPGMIMKADVLGRAIDAAVGAPAAGEGAVGGPGGPGGPGGQDDRPRLLMSARGVPLTQSLVRQLAAGPGLLAVCGRFEGVDERVIAGRGLLEVSIGDFILSGGEIAAMALIDACVRLIPGVMGKEVSAVEESFSAGLLEHPQFTRPPLWEGRAIPEVLMSGDHGKVAAWRRSEAERLTRERRPDLWAAYLGEPRQGAGD
jgi:tRNA (guanine37-N1)-methyltransferase